VEDLLITWNSDAATRHDQILDSLAAIDASTTAVATAVNDKSTLILDQLAVLISNQEASFLQDTGRNEKLDTIVTNTEPIDNMRDVINDIGGVMNDIVGGIVDIRNLADAQWSVLQFISSTLGAGDGPPNDIIGILRTIAEQTVPQPGCACLSSKNAPAACEFGTAYASTDTLYIPGSLLGGLDFNVATFNALPPDGISYGDTFGLPTSTELESDDWAGWSVFVASESPLFSWNPISPDRYPTNEWLAISAGPHNFSFSVDELSGIKVYLCPPATSEPPEGQSGAYGLNQAVPYNPEHIIVFGDVSATFASIDTGILNPRPSDAPGYTLYFHWCWNDTDGPDKSIYIGSSTDPESIFLEVENGVSAPWVVDPAVTGVYAFVQSDSNPSSVDGFKVTFGWTPEEAEIAC